MKNTIFFIYKQLLVIYYKCRDLLTNILFTTTASPLSHLHGNIEVISNVIGDIRETIRALA